MHSFAIQAWADHVKASLATADDRVFDPLPDNARRRCLPEEMSSPSKRQRTSDCPDPDETPTRPRRQFLRHDGHGAVFDDVEISPSTRSTSSFAAVFISHEALPKDGRPSEPGATRSFHKGASYRERASRQFSTAFRSSLGRRGQGGDSTGSSPRAFGFSGHKDPRLYVEIHTSPLMKLVRTARRTFSTIMHDSETLLTIPLRRLIFIHPKSHGTALFTRRFYGMYSLALPFSKSCPLPRPRSCQPFVPC